MGEREIGIIACRRKYIPPVMDSSQVIVVTYFGGKGKWDHDETFMDSPERIVDSLTATSLCHVPDRLVIQTKADALLFDEEGYAWFHKRLNVQPRAMHRVPPGTRMSRVAMGQVSGTLPDMSGVCSTRKTDADRRSRLPGASKSQLRASPCPSPTSAR